MTISRLLQPSTMCFGLLVLGAVAQAANDWPQWRGPNRDGRSAETGLLKQWPAGGPKLLWKATGLGGGYSSIATSSDKVFSMGDKGEECFIVALNRADGKPLWSAKVGQAGAPGWGGYAGPRCTPATDGQLVLAVGQWGDFICVDAATGAEKWRKDYAKDFGGKRPEWGFAESPLLDGTKVIVTPGGRQGAIVALDKKSGATVWQSKEFTDSAHYSSLIIAEIGGVRQYIQLTDASVAGVAADDGRLLWRAPRKGSTAVIPTPVYHDGIVFVTSSYGVGCNAFKVTAAGGKFVAEQLYANKTLANHHGGVLRVGDHIYGHSEGKGWVCLDLKTGEAAWEEKRKASKGSVVYADGHLILRAEEGKGTVWLIEASPDGFREKGRFDPPNRSEQASWAHPVVSDGKLWLRDQDILLCYDLTGK
ncbi:MAG TPA: PQQ-binding-like beta-propeller repeat protein [Verrucomicrobiae bacterium]|nr:PQQ-binding-like beta-propeller repeat protein [Verrucomicrobiae bacterium]